MGNWKAESQKSEIGNVTSEQFTFLDLCIPKLKVGRRKDGRQKSEKSIQFGNNCSAYNLDM